jgi:membrane protease subunit HflC
MGIDVIDVQIKRVSYNKQVQVKLFNRMVSEQNMIAEKYRAQGQGKKQEILGKQIQREKEIVSGSYLKSQEIKGRADAKASEIYANSYGKSPEFYNFYKTLDTYKNTLDPSTYFILSTDSKYLKVLEQ